MFLAGGYRRRARAPRFSCRPRPALGDKPAVDVTWCVRSLSGQTLLRSYRERVEGLTGGQYFVGTYCFAQFNELEQLGSQFTTLHFPVETVTSPGS